MKNEQTTADLLAARAQQIRTQREAGVARKAQVRRTAVIAGLAAIPVSFIAAVIAAGITGPAPHDGPNWRDKVNSSTQNERVVVAAEAVGPSAEQLAWCEKYGILTENCVDVHTTVKNGGVVEGVNYFGDRRESYSEHLAAQQERKADLKYCAKNPTDWSCSEGQYAGQY